MSSRPVFRETPTVRELLERATWDDLSRIAAHHSIQFAGRRRGLAVERLAALLERPEQLRAAERIVAEPTRAVLGLLLLLGQADDERTLAQARDQLVAIRPELAVTLGRAHLANELQRLTALGLCFRDRRRFVMPAEVVETLTPVIRPALPVDALQSDAVSYAALRYAIERLVTAIAEHPPVALPPHVPTDRVAPYHTLLLLPDSAATLGASLDLSAADVVLLVAVLEAAGVLAAVRGRWQVQARWQTLRFEPPRTLLEAVVAAWLHPRALSDVQRTGALIWMCAPEADAAALVAQHEARLRALLWRWLNWCGQEPIDGASLSATLAALHGGGLVLNDDIWLSATRAARAEVDDPQAVAQALVPQWLAQLARLGLVITDAERSAWTPTAAWWLYEHTPDNDSAIRSRGRTALLVHPLAAPPDVLQVISRAGRMEPPQDDLLRYELTAQGMAELAAFGNSPADLEQVLLQAGAQLGSDLREQLAHWSERAGRLRLHRPLTMLVTAEDTPLAQVLAAAGLSEAAEVIGPGCALVDPEAVEPALEQLRARGYWPQVIR